MCAQVNIWEPMSLPKKEQHTMPHCLICVLSNSSIAMTILHVEEVVHMVYRDCPTIPTSSGQYRFKALCPESCSYLSWDVECPAPSRPCTRTRARHHDSVRAATIIASAQCLWTSECLYVHNMYRLNHGFRRYTGNIPEVLITTARGRNPRVVYSDISTEDTASVPGPPSFLAIYSRLTFETPCLSEVKGQT